MFLNYIWSSRVQRITSLRRGGGGGGGGVESWLLDDMGIAVVAVALRLSHLLTKPCSCRWSVLLGSGDKQERHTRRCCRCPACQGGESRRA